MPKVKISEFDIDPANNTDINSINIAEGCAPSGINNAIRQLMSDLKEFQTGGAGDPFNGAVNGTVGATTPSTAVVTTLTANTSVSTDLINEKTSAAGITIDGVLLKDNAVSASSGFTQSSTFNSVSTFGFKNRIINGAMTIDQRNAGASVTNTGLKIYSLDRWFIQGVSSSKFTAQQNAGSVTPPTGFTNYLGITSSAATSVGSSDYYFTGQSIEGFNTADLNWGTANAQTVTLSFWVRSSLTGTFGGSLRNSDGNRSYPFTYTISSANTWEQKTVTIAGDTTGTWIGATNGIGIDLSFNLGAGSTFSGTAGAWAGSNFISATGATNVVSTNGATFYITGVQLEKGTTATSFDYRPYGTELSLCQRYYEKLLGNGTASVFGAGSANSTTDFRAYVRFSVPKRTSPTMTFSAANTFLYQGITTSSPSAITSAASSLISSLVSSSGTYTAGLAYTLLDNVSSSTFIADERDISYMGLPYWLYFCLLS
jgi:hypothetical protein